MGLGEEYVEKQLSTFALHDLIHDFDNLFANRSDLNWSVTMLKQQELKTIRELENLVS